MHSPGPHMSLRIPAKWWLLLACCLALALGVSAYSDHLRVLAYRNTLASALSPRLTGVTLPVSWSFPFQSSRVMVTLEVDEAELSSACAMDTARIFGSRGTLRERYVKSVVTAQAESPFLDRLAAEFRRLRDERGLDSDEYLELLAAGVQSIPYGDTDVDTLLAPEVLAVGSGICTDKSLLLASLLVHEDYDTVMWVFSTQRHVAVGVRSSQAQFRQTGYAFIETTALRFVGQCSQEYLAPGPVSNPPAQIELGGTKGYGAGDEVELILAELRRLKPIAEEHVTLASIARTAVRYRERYAERALESWIADGEVRFIMTNAHDREGVYSILAGTAQAGASPQMPAR